MFPSMETLNGFSTTTATAPTDLYRLEERYKYSTSVVSPISSPKRSRRSIQKRVVTVPVKDVEGSRLKSDCSPPIDSWAWRKYGQKPIKGSPYPRGYYRCSSSKGCPARKQVERSHSNPSTIVITYSYEHNHPWPTSRTRHNSTCASTSTSATAQIATSATPLSKMESINDIINGTTDGHVGEALVVPTDELTWLTDTSSSFFSTYSSFGDLDMGKIFPLGEGEEALFADLGELPECSVVFGQPAMGRRDDGQQQQDHDPPDFSQPGNMD